MSINHDLDAPGKKEGREGSRESGRQPSLPGVIGMSKDQILQGDKLG